MAKYSCRKRTFLNPLPSEFNSYISVITESSVGGTYAFGTYVVTIADCRGIIELEFPLGDAKRRRQSLHKIDELLDTLATFRTALYEEAQLIAKKQ